ncbi:MAG: VIT1/CCC1 transporter family protein [bacterium]|nr:VIT1/CCC1 transporter family protein [bacterium]
MSIEYNPDYIHHQNGNSTALFREMVFGMEDGMVSTLGAITGIAAATGSHFTVILSGLVIISVESISMAVGSYLSSKSAKGIDERKLVEERIELKKFPEEEKKELIEMYIIDGWPKELAFEMAEVASHDKKLFLQEMAYRELGIVPEKMENPLKNGSVMLLSYMVGGFIPLLAYFVFNLQSAIVLSILLTLVSLFMLGVYTSRFSKRNWFKAGFEMFALATIAASVGYGVGQAVEYFFK